MTYLLGVCGIVLLMLILKKNAQIILNFFVRIVVGAILIIFVNDFFANQNIPIIVGLNPITFLTSGILGIPGVAALYVICWLKILF